MRGKVTAPSTLMTAFGITPAYAGKRQKGKLFVFCLQDHPRLCGEKWCPCRRSRWNWGSPPPMRGKVQVFFGKMLRTGITPAYAGKRSHRRNFYNCIKDHPRLCGEKYLYFFTSFTRLGSPPPMRGKVQPANVDFFEDGITPAYAGKSAAFPCKIHPFWDHPRLCGEKTKKIPKQRYFFHQSASFSFSLQYT